MSVETPGHGDRRAHDGEKENKTSAQPLPRALIVFNALSLLLSAVLTYSTCTYTTYARKQWKAAKQGIATSRQMAEAIERPWVMFDQSPPDNPATEYQDANWATTEGLGIHVVNFGKGPAFNLSWAVWGGDDDGPLDVDTLPVHGWHSTGPGALILPPGEPTLIQYQWTMLPENQPHPIMGDNVLALVSLAYFDAFGRSHQTVFCVEGTVSHTTANLRMCYADNYAD